MLREESLSSVTRPSLRTLTYGAIKQAILDMQPRLATQLREPELHGQLRVSRTPDHGALLCLKQEGFIEGESFQSHVAATLARRIWLRFLRFERSWKGTACAERRLVLTPPSLIVCKRSRSRRKRQATEGDTGRCNQLFTEFDDILPGHLGNKRMPVILGSPRD